jgi:hypothetical protein
MVNRAVIVIVVVTALCAADALASPVGDNYWLAFGPFATVAGHFQGEADETSEANDMLLAAGLGVAHVGAFAWAASVEGGGLPWSGAGQVRGELRFGSYYVTIGATVAQTIAHRGALTAGPSACFSWPFFTAKEPRDGSAHVLSVFYRLDFPLGDRADEYTLRHVAGVSFLFDVPALLRVFSMPAKPWYGPRM